MSAFSTLLVENADTLENARKMWIFACHFDVPLKNETVRKQHFIGVLCTRNHLSDILKQTIVSVFKHILLLFNVQYWQSLVKILQT